MLQLWTLEQQRCALLHSQAPASVALLRCSCKCKVACSRSGPIWPPRCCWHAGLRTSARDFILTCHSLRSWPSSTSTAPCALLSALPDLDLHHHLNPQQRQSAQLHSSTTVCSNWCCSRQSSQYARASWAVFWYCCASCCPGHSPHLHRSFAAFAMFPIDTRKSSVPATLSWHWSCELSPVIHKSLLAFPSSRLHVIHQSSASRAGARRTCPPLATPSAAARSSG